MRETRDIMGMPITLTLADTDAARFEEVFTYFMSVDERFSTYKEGSEISRFNRGGTTVVQISPELAEVFTLAEKTKIETRGYFDITRPDGLIDPSGIVKGWAIQKAADLLVSQGVTAFCIEAGGDIATHGTNLDGTPWSVGIKNPFNSYEIVKVIYPKGAGVATSGSYLRGAHIYNPLNITDPLTEVVSITVIAPDVLEADRYATAAFAMGKSGITFIEGLEGFEGYAIDAHGIATMTSGFMRYATP